MRFRKDTDHPPTNGRYFVRGHKTEMFEGRLGWREAIYFNGQEWITMEQGFEWLDESEHSEKEVSQAMHDYTGPYFMGCDYQVIDAERAAFKAGVRWTNEISL